MASRFTIDVPSPPEATTISDIHLAAMDNNLLTHAQFPTAPALRFFHAWLERNTAQHVRDADKHVLVARDAASRQVVSFVKWLVHAPGGGESAARNLEGWSGRGAQHVLNAYAEMTARMRFDAMGTRGYYHVVFLCTAPQYTRQGAARLLMRRVQQRAAADKMPVILESTMEGTALYTSLGFQAVRQLEMKLPARASHHAAEVYRELIMVWTGPAA
ncbi:hypothetical protein CDD81_2557 [Ophiocordyceps australis]|uniref:N-acetyltransferase domain-containing protein n=1 Tax=Ophiocordyceps australis TaxID=1399860 RepID=A0A2C5XEM7_9HYPO|nr:hypothetical protein CDD81_2557 [Ophiocordyceps australis]